MLRKIEIDKYGRPKLRITEPQESLCPPASCTISRIPIAMLTKLALSVAHVCEGLKYVPKEPRYRRHGKAMAQNPLEQIT